MRCTTAATSPASLPCVRLRHRCRLGPRADVAAGAIVESAATAAQDCRGILNPDGRIGVTDVVASGPLPWFIAAILALMNVHCTWTRAQYEARMAEAGASVQRAVPEVRSATGSGGRPELALSEYLSEHGPAMAD